MHKIKHETDRGRGGGEVGQGDRFPCGINTPSPGAPEQGVGQRIRQRLTGTRGPLAFALFWLVVLYPVMRRVVHPTIFSDDLIRLVRLIEHPLSDLLFLPFYEHVTPLFEFVSWTVWQMIGHDLRLAPLGFTVASVFPWILVLLLLGVWLREETGSRAAAFVAVALVAQSPLVLQTVWWFSASSFAWAIAGILLALIGATELSYRPRLGAAAIFVGCALGPASTSLGYLAFPLAALRVVLGSGLGLRARAVGLVAAGLGLSSFFLLCGMAGMDLLRPMISHDPGFFDAMTGKHRSSSGLYDPWVGLSCTVALPGQILLPSTLGVPACWPVYHLPQWASWSAGIAVLVALVALAIRPKASWDRRTIVMGSAMIYLGYMLTYSARGAFLRESEAARNLMLYEHGSRYHVVPLLGLAAVLASLLAAWKPIRRLDLSPWLPPTAGGIVGLLMLAVNHREVCDHWTAMLGHDDQRPTLAALQRTSVVARAEGIPREQLVRLGYPACRTWTAGAVPEYPFAFPLMLLVEAPMGGKETRTDDQVRALLTSRLAPRDRIAAGYGTCAYLTPSPVDQGARVVSVARLVERSNLEELGPGLYRSGPTPGSIKYQFDRTANARYLELPGLPPNQEVVVQLCDGKGVWRAGLSFRWKRPADPTGPTVVDLGRMPHTWGEPITQVAIQLLQTGEIPLEGSARLLR